MMEYFRKIKNGELEKLKNYLGASWIKVVNPNEKEIEFLTKKFSLERNLLIDGLDLYEVPRIEEENKNLYVFLRVPTSKIENEFTSSFLVVLTKNNIVTVSQEDLEIFEKLSASRYFLKSGVSRDILQILSYVFNSFSLNVRKIIKEVKRDKRNIRKLKEKGILELILQEDILNEYLSSLSQLIDMYNKILKAKVLRFKEDEKEFVEDLIVDVNQTFNTCRAALKTISNMREYYSTTLSNNLNRIITIMTVFTIFLTIPTVISSIYGMNIILPFQETPNIFLLLVSITLLIWIIVFIAFKRWEIV